MRRHGSGPQSDREHLVRFPEVAITETPGEVAAGQAERLRAINKSRNRVNALSIATQYWRVLLSS
jgi:hypothetical protein